MLVINLTCVEIVSTVEYFSPVRAVGRPKSHTFNETWNFSRVIW